MAYTALYRKFRPLDFSEVKGQDAIVKTLSNQVKSERIGHAFLFCGTRGTGKTSVAKIMARAVNCENPVDGSPCNKCSICRSILDGSSMNVVEIDAASNNGVENVRQIVEEVRYSPTEGKYRVYIIDEVHMLSPGAFNALLKTLEEPPSYVIFILATTEMHKVPVTILSRCQRYDFRRIATETIADRLRELCDREGLEADDDALVYIARMGDGSMRDALSLLERCTALYFDERLTRDATIDMLGATEVDIPANVLRCISMGNVAGFIAEIDELMDRGRDLSRFLVDLISYARNILLVKSRGTVDFLDLRSDQIELLIQEKEYYEEEQLFRYIDSLSELSNRMRNATQKRIMLETAFIRLAKPQMETGPDAVLDRLRSLEAEIVELRKNPRSVSPAEPVPDEEEEEQEIELPPAAKEDVQLLLDNWRAMAGGVRDSLMKLNFTAAKKYMNTEGRLILAYEKKLDYNYAVEHKPEIGNVLAQYMGKSFDFDVLMNDKVDKNKNADIDALADMLSRLAPGVPVIKK